MADDLAMAAGDLALVPRQEGMIKTNARFRTQGIWLNGPAKGIKKLFVFIRYWEPGRRPGGPLARFGQSGKPAANVVATIVALPPGIWEMGSHLDL